MFIAASRPLTNRLRQERDVVDSGEHIALLTELATLWQRRCYKYSVPPGL